MNIFAIVRRIGAQPEVRQHTLSALATCATLLEGLHRGGRRRRRHGRHPRQPKK